MSTKLFTSEEIEILSKNKYVKKLLVKVLHILMNSKGYLYVKMKIGNFVRTEKQILIEE